MFTHEGTAPTSLLSSLRVSPSGRSSKIDRFRSTGELKSSCLRGAGDITDHYLAKTYANYPILH